MKFGSVRLRVTAWYGGMFAVTLACLGVLAYVGLEQYLDRILRNTLRYDAKTIGETVLDHAAGRPQGYLASEIGKRSFNARFIRVTRGDGIVIYESEPPADRTFDPRRIGRPPENATEISRDEHDAGPRPILVYTYPFSASDGRLYVIETGNTYTRTRQMLHELSLLFACIFPLALAFAVAGGWVAIGRALRPVRELSRDADRISWQQRHERLPVPLTGDELEQLSRTLNSMLDRLDDAFQRIHRFSADVSHELRTPLTIIRGELESIVRQVPCSPQILDGVGSSLEEVERLSRIVEHLLVLCRLDSGNDATPAELVDVGKLAKDTAEQMRLLFVEKDLHLTLDASANVMVSGTPVRLRQVVVNLLDNAIKYSNTGGRIELRVATEGDIAVLEVADNGCGVSAAHLPHLFERFYRADRARSRASGGVGLGLSIVQAIAASHGGRVSVVSVEGSGSTFRFEIPAVLDADPSLPKAVPALGSTHSMNGNL